MTWQPIETAPKDGTPILGWSDEGVAYVCWWRPGRRGTAWAFFYAPDVGTFSFHPTLWQPLPEPPEPKP